MLKPLAAITDPRLRPGASFAMLEEEQGREARMDRIAFDVPEALRSVVEEGLARLGYIYPNLDFRFDPASSQILAEGPGSGTDPQALRKELLYQLYREKIFRDTLPIRRRLYGSP